MVITFLHYFDWGKKHHSQFRWTGGRTKDYVGEGKIQRVVLKTSVYSRHRENPHESHEVFQSESLGVILPIVSFNSFASLSPAEAICLSTTLISRW